MTRTKRSYAALQVLGFSIVIAVGTSGVGLAQAMTLQTVGGQTLKPSAIYRVISARDAVETLRIEFVKVRPKDGAAVPEIYWITETPKDYWIAEKKADGEKGGIEWADSRACPSFASMAEQLDRVAAMSANDEGPAPNATVQTFQIIAPLSRSSGASPDARRTGVAGDAVASQIEGAARALSPCWTSAHPSLG